MTSNRWADVTVVVPAHNAENTLERALASVARQTVAPAEVVVVDDASADATAAVAEALAATVVRTRAPGGAAMARNAGLRRARTRWCALLDADDAWDPGHLAAHCHGLDDAEPPLQFTSGRRVLPGGRVLGRPQYRERAVSARPLELLLGQVRPTTSAALVERAAALALGGFNEDEDFRPSSCEDLDLWLRLAEETPARVLPDVTVAYTVDDSRRPADRLARNEAARLRTVAAALDRLGAGAATRDAVWRETWLDLGRWHLKHGSRSDARRCFALAARRSAWPAVAWLALALAPEAAHRTARRAARLLR